MLKNLFNFKKQKTLPEAALFYGVCLLGYFVLSGAAERWMAGGF